MKKGSDSSEYKSFIGRRDLALEEILQKYRLITSDTLRGFLSHSLELCAGLYSMVKKDGHAFHITSMDRLLNDRLEKLVVQYGDMLYDQTNSLRSKAYLLSYVGEGEALSRALHRPLIAKITQSDIQDTKQSQNNQGEDSYSRIQLALTRIKRKILDAVELSLITEDSTQEMMDRVIRTFPEKKYYKRPPRSLKPIKEADTPTQDKKSLIQGIVSNEVWQDLVQDYKSEYIPVNRSPDSILDIDIGEPELEETYAWEIEKSMTDDFVSKVRQGQIDAARENGVTDFIWIAIIDDKTDECCVWRDGLLVSEIEKELGGKHRDDPCDGSVPPIHPKCRCRIEPVTDEIKDYPIQDIDLSDFDEWLEGNS